MRHCGEGVRFFGTVEVGPNCIIEDYCLIGKPDMYVLDEARRNPAAPLDPTKHTVLGADVTLGAGTKVYSGCVLLDGVETEDDVRIGWDSHIGARTRIMYRAQVYCGVSIGNDCRVAGFVGDNVRIFDRVAFFGSAVHDYPYRTTTYEYRPSPVIEEDAIVGTGAVIVGGVTVGQNAYVAANAVVTRDIPPGFVCYGFNALVPRNEWKGKLGRFDRRA